MKSEVIALLLVIASGCGAAGPSARAMPSLAPRFGGVMVSLGEHAVELVAHGTGELHVHVRSEAELSGAGVSVTLHDEHGDLHTLALPWADPVQGFVGLLETVPAPGEATVLVVHGETLHRGTARIERLLPSPVHDGSVVALGEHTIEVVVEPDGRAVLYVHGGHRLDGDPTLCVASDDGLHPLALSWDAGESRYVGRLEGITPRPGPMQVIVRDATDSSSSHRVARGTLHHVGSRATTLEAPESLRLELPELGSQLPAVIAIPPVE